MDYHCKYSFVQELYEVEFAQALIVVAYWEEEEEEEEIISHRSNCKDWIARVSPPNV